MKNLSLNFVDLRSFFGEGLRNLINIILLVQYFVTSVKLYLDYIVNSKNFPVPISLLFTYLP